MTSRPVRRARPGVVFISHDAWRNGAPIVLLRFLTWLKTHSSLPFSVVLRDGAGELRPDFEQLCPLVAWNELEAAPRSWPASMYRRRSESDPLKSVLASTNVGLVYSNTITNGRLLKELAAPGRPVITHVHELEYWMTHRLDPLDLQETIRYT